MEDSSCALRAVELTKRFGDLVAVDRLSLEVRGGEIFGLLGPNGAGKTTTIQMLCGLLPFDGGEVFLEGRALSEGGADARARVGVSPQQVVLWQRLTCLEQLEFVGEMYGVPRAEARRRGERLLETLGLAEKRDRLAGTLSGGMQRRLSLALALVHEPEIVVLDEPEAGLDPQSRVLVREYIATLVRRQGRTVILTTHNMDEAERLADRVAIIDRGRLLALDSPEALRRQGGGDTLELAFDGGAAAVDPTQRARLAAAVPGSTVSGDSLLLREPAVIERLPAILDTLRSLGLRPGRVQLRPSTLEDVFIALTGRKLRE